MRILLSFIVSLVISVSLFGQQLYKGQSYSQIEWDKIDTKEWLKFSEWREQTTKLSKVSLEEKTLKQGSYKEIVGIVAHCVGDCRNYRDYGFSPVIFHSVIRESDEITTQTNSYLWIFLVDGTMVRLSPESSITFREINVTNDEFFYHARINYGDVLWMSRERNGLDEQTQRETETIFDPLPYELALAERIPKNPPKDLFDSLLPNDEALKYRELNLLIEQNNQVMKPKKSYAFLIMPNGTLFGEQPFVEMIVIPGKESYFKMRSYQTFKSDFSESRQLQFLYRGYDNVNDYLVTDNNWYLIGPDGDNVETYSDDQKFGMGELLTKRIPSILLAREFLLKSKSLDLFATELNKTTLALDDGYRLWGQMSSEQSDLNRRLAFVKNYTRRMETTNLLIAKKLRNTSEFRNESEAQEYGPRFYIAALNSFQTKRELSRVSTDRESLNSTQRPLWKRIERRKSEVSTDLSE